ncbi:MAG: hypothetical protein A4E53_04683 [Pelotomaculum sp. PtaB.Bin104]|nr:MAG: hypothetical protein A4E53_04683 [Pelotomaculum sp. PtaB.Bin104]
MELKKWRLGAVLFAVLILTGAVTGISFASKDQTGTPKLNETYQDFVSKLAVNLGIDETTVKSALNSTKQQMIDEAIQKGKITREQADKFSAKDGFGGFVFLDGKCHGPKGMARNLDEIASILEMTVDELKAKMESGQKLEEIVAGQGMTMEQFHEKMLEQKKSKIAKKVADGVLTQEQADKILQEFGQRLSKGSKGNNSGA